MANNRSLASARLARKAKAQKAQVKVQLHPIQGRINHDLIHSQVRWLNNYHVTRYSEQRHLEHSYGTQKDYLESFDGAGSQMWLIITDEGIIGSVTAETDLRNGVSNIGIMIGNDKAWGKGYGHVAWESLCQMLFAGGVRKIEAGCMASNKAMLSVFKKTGMKVEARIKGHFLLDGKSEDMILVGRWK